MASIEDLIATVSNSMHVGQHGQDLRALQDMLSQSIAIPQHPTNGYLPPSRSTSVTRTSQHMPLNTPLGHGFDMGMGQGQPFPSPVTLSSNTSDLNTRPGNRLRQRSYGFPRVYEDSNQSSASTCTAGPSKGWQGFGSDNDAFATNHQYAQQSQEEVDPWARLRAAQATSAFGQQYAKPQESSPWAGFNGSSNSAFGQQQQYQYQTPQQRFGNGRMPTPPDEDEEMDMDEVEDEAAEEEYAYNEPSRASGFGNGGGGIGMDEKRVLSMSQLEGEGEQQLNGLWQRGRRKT